jgi:competence protein ComEC
LLNNKITCLIEDRDFPDYIENSVVIIDDMNYKRYSSEIYFHTDEYNHQRLRGVIYYQGENVFDKGDNLVLHKRIHKIKPDSKTQFNNYLISRGIRYSTGLTENDITLIKKNEFPIRADLQNNLLKKIDSIFSQPSAGVIKALLTGNQNYIEKKIIFHYRDSGVLHCLSASGLHVAIFAAIPSFLLLPFFRRNKAALASLVSVIFYLLITDMPVSLLRAVIMFGLFYIGLILFRTKNVFNYLMLTCSIILCFSPWEIFSPGFQLSFAATAGILIFYKQYRKSLNALPAIIADTTAVTLSAQLTTLPIILFHMNQMNTIGIISNIIIIPLITLIMGVSMIAISISYLSVQAAFIPKLFTDLLLKLSLITTDFISNLKLNFYVFEITPLLSVIILISLIPLINHKIITRLKFYPILISALLCTVYLKKNYQMNGGNYVITSGNSTAEIRKDNNNQILKLNLAEGVDIEKIICRIKEKNPDITIIELDNCSNSNLLASSKLMNDYAIKEYRFNNMPDINDILKKIIFQLEKDDVFIKFN